ncbi:unnamed protein product [Lactuca saligna]|uniref:Uncharacterized protein n=1 Tax=Lactuca saligna TaxID=75948 RepID=A0AA36A1L8_LACSI|nr:unnamed protein product [Lactuca saligna]
MFLSMEKCDPSALQRSGEEDEDTMSLSDFSIYCDENVESWIEGPSMSDQDEQDFEFSSEIGITSHDLTNPIIFCGKIVHVSSKNIQENENKKPLDMHHGGSMERKVSILTSKSKSRWYVFMFGFGSLRFPTEMHISDLRKRKICVPTKRNDNYKFNKGDPNGIGKSRGLIRFLGCCVAPTKVTK